MELGIELGYCEMWASSKIIFERHVFIYVNARAMEQGGVTEHATAGSESGGNREPGDLL